MCYEIEQQVVFAKIAGVKEGLTIYEEEIYEEDLKEGYALQWNLYIENDKFTQAGIMTQAYAEAIHDHRHDKENMQKLIIQAKEHNKVVMETSLHAHHYATEKVISLKNIESNCVVRNLSL